jgi:hypothetical protein
MFSGEYSPTGAQVDGQRVSVRAFPLMVGEEKGRVKLSGLSGLR